MNKKEEAQSQLVIIPKSEKYIEYMLEVVLLKLPRVEKFSIGNDYKDSMYLMLRYILLISKSNKSEVMQILNRIDTELSLQRIYLRIMRKNRWIDIKKFDVAMGLIYEIGKILGGLIKHYAQNNQK